MDTVKIDFNRAGLCFIKRILLSRANDQ